MLKNNLYTITSAHEQESGRFVAEVQLEAAHALFKGHFPEQPVLPGVCLLEMLKELLGEWHSKPFRLKSAATIKFIKLVDPRAEPVLKFEIQTKQEEQELNVSASSFLQDGAANFKFKGTFVPISE